MAMELRMCVEDRDTYGGPEWVLFDLDSLVDVPCNVLEEWENLTGFTITDLWSTEQRKTRGIRMMLWIARRQAGMLDKWEDFNPRVLRLDTKVPEVGDDTVPPEPSSESSEGTG
jgi:hypothetical protein